MLSELPSMAKVVGVKQSKKVIRDGGAKRVFIAADAERRITDPIRTLCEEHDVEVIDVSSMRQLGETVGIAVGAAVVAVTE
ncbi:MAG TPA: ribosomal L7Ae/L30e/S12e/Gadd45 family protein [Candidatus Butyricicoccus stercorigallinarum]|nr:ribosomal L7Ae/L30e/S12e/Gadd45 family protein [Candidatus Butyricicoccus stercorigallinarum]